MANAKSVEDDINRSRALANEIVRRSEAPEVSGQTLREAEGKVQFLRRETAYNRQVHQALSGIKHVNALLNQVEVARDERRVLESLHLLEKAWTALDEISVSKSCRVMRTLDMRSFELKSSVHEVFNDVWHSLVQVDVNEGSLRIHQAQQGKSGPALAYCIGSPVSDVPMNLSEALIGLKAYKEVGQRMALLWHGLDDAIVGPRTLPESVALPGIKVDDVCVWP